MSWIYLSISIVLEVLGTTSLKIAADGGKHTTIATIMVAVFYVSSFGVLQFVLKVIPLGTVYAIWAGVGVALMALIGIFFFGDSINTLKVVSIMLVIVGIVGLNLSGISH